VKNKSKQPSVLNQIDALQQLANTFEASADTMRADLYTTLAKMMRFKKSLGNSVDLRTFNRFCAEQDIPSHSKEARYPAVIKAIWRDRSENRIKGALRYGRVLQKAEAENISANNLVKWITGAGGYG